jgi:heptosyltransferase-2
MTLPRLELDLEPILVNNYITVHPFTGWSKYKEWPIERWEELIKQIQEHSEVPVSFIQIGTANETKLIGCDHSFMGGSLMDSINLIANAKLHMGGDSFSNHVTHLTNTPAIILWGSTQVSASGYEKNINISLGLPCQPCFKESPYVSSMSRGPCENPPEQIYNNPKHKCMYDITVDMVYNKLQEAFSL